VRSAALSIGHKDIGGRGCASLFGMTEFSSSRGSVLTAGPQHALSSLQITVDAWLLVPLFGGNQESLSVRCGETTSSALAASLLTSQPPSLSHSTWSGRSLPHSAQTRITDEEGPRACRHLTGARHYSQGSACEPAPERNVVAGRTAECRDSADLDRSTACLPRAASRNELDPPGHPAQAQPAS
jgi:hypothetical protein